MRGFRAWVVLSFAAIAGCGSPDPGTTAIVGGTAVVGQGRTIPDSVIVVKGARVMRIGTRAETPIPAGSAKIDAAGKFVVADPSRPGELKPGSRADLVLSSDASGTPAERAMREGQWVE